MIDDEVELGRRIKEARRKKIQSVMGGFFQHARPHLSYQDQKEAIIPRHFFRQKHLRVLCERQFSKLNEIDQDEA
jgi:hypothetical protein